MGIKGLAKLLSDEAPDVSFSRDYYEKKRSMTLLATLWKFGGGLMDIVFLLKKSYIIHHFFHSRNSLMIGIIIQ